MLVYSEPRTRENRVAAMSRAVQIHKRICRISCYGVSQCEHPASFRGVSRRYKWLVGGIDR